MRNIIRKAKLAYLCRKLARIQGALSSLVNQGMLKDRRNLEWVIALRDSLREKSRRTLKKIRRMTGEEE